MQALKITLEGVTCSFRYPHFMIGVQPTYMMPPVPSIYGHICSTLGSRFRQQRKGGFAFAYRFTYEAKFEDLEHIHVLAASSGKFVHDGIQYNKVLEGHTNPLRREVLFQPRLVLYIDKPEWKSAFHEPRYPVVLGRSQDLATYTSIKVVDLEAREDVYFEHTLLPYKFAASFPVGLIIQMPGWVNKKSREPQWEQYIVLQRRVYASEIQGEQQRYWADPEETDGKGAMLGLIFHQFEHRSHYSVA